MISKEDLKVYEEAIEKRVQKLKAVIALYQEDDFSKYLDLKEALAAVAIAANNVDEVLEWDHSL
ncbi:MAG: hypothetical protein NTX75_05400 [Proteobacteria bacterium]|nr:hypothetical protein [Pseudomonadota bacterium]